MDKADLLKEAIGTGELLTIVYHGGSQPGSVREILPLQITETKLRARCYSSNAVKQFLIEKIEVCKDAVETKTTWDERKVGQQRYNSIIDFHDDNNKTLCSLGWHVKLNGKDGDDLISISLHTLKRNGDPKKASEVDLTYEKYVQESLYNPFTDSFEDSTNKKKRPYCVRSKNLNATSYGKIDKAVAVFIEQAEKLAPNNN